VDVSQPRQTGPASKFFDEIFANIIEAQSHGTASLQGVSTDLRRRVATVERSSQEDTFSNG
jgi:hypothetical protein